MAAFTIASAEGSGSPPRPKCCPKPLASAAAPGVSVAAPRGLLGELHPRLAGVGSSHPPGTPSDVQAAPVESREKGSHASGQAKYRVPIRGPVRADACPSQGAIGAWANGGIQTTPPQGFRSVARCMPKPMCHRRMRQRGHSDNASPRHHQNLETMNAQPIVTPSALQNNNLTLEYTFLCLCFWRARARAGRTDKQTDTQTGRSAPSYERRRPLRDGRNLCDGRSNRRWARAQRGKTPHKTAWLRECFHAGACFLRWRGRRSRHALRTIIPSRLRTPRRQSSAQPHGGGADPTADVQLDGANSLWGPRQPYP